MKSAIVFHDTLSSLLKNALAMAMGYKREYDSISNKKEFVQSLYLQTDVASAKWLQGFYRMQRIMAGDVGAYKLAKRGKDEEYKVVGKLRLLASKIE